MSATTTTGIQYATGGDPAAIHTVSQNLALSLNPMICPSVADETARNSVFNTDIAAGRTGMTCYVRSRLGICTYIGVRSGIEPTNGWMWHAQNRVVLDYFQVGFVQGSTGPYATVYTSNSLPLDGGQRLVEITWGLDIMVAASFPLNGPAAVRVPLLINGAPQPEMLQHGTDATTASTVTYTAATLMRTSKRKMNGAFTVAMQIGMTTSASGYIDAWHPRIQVTDLGPID